MAAKTKYQDFVSDEKALEYYENYQSRYRTEIRESDKILISLISKLRPRKDAQLLDIGCSTGNLLRHIQRLIPELHLYGAELSASSLKVCRSDPELAYIKFHALDMLNIGQTEYFDIVVANAVTYLFSWEDYEKALRSVHSALKPGGVFLGFEWMHPFDLQDLKIIETSKLHPEGVMLHSRPISTVRKLIFNVGFSEIEFFPFEIPIDLPFVGYDADVVTYTRKDDSGHRMAFRGALYQPWCHFYARKPM